MKTLDVKRLEREIENMADSPVSMHLAIRRFPGFWTAKPLPSEFSSYEEAQKYAKSLAAGEGLKVGLISPNSGTVWFDEKGRVISRTHSDGE